jgi:hypothetical protein
MLARTNKPLNKQLVVTQVLLHFLRVNAQMCNLTKQKTAQGLKTLVARRDEKTVFNHVLTFS